MATRRTRLMRLLRDAGGFSIMEVLLVVAIITFLTGVLIVAFGKVREYGMKKKTRTMIEAIDSAMSSYYLHFHKWPPSEHAVGNTLEELKGSECLVYYLTNCFAEQEDIDETAAVDPGRAAAMKLADRTCGPFYTSEPQYLKDLDGDGYMSLLDPFGREYLFVAAPKPVDFNNQIVNEFSYNLWSPGDDGFDDKGDGDDVCNWKEEGE